MIGFALFNRFLSRNSHCYLRMFQVQVASKLVVGDPNRPWAQEYNGVHPTRKAARSQSIHSIEADQVLPHLCAVRYFRYHCEICWHQEVFSISVYRFSLHGYEVPRWIPTPFKHTDRNILTKPPICMWIIGMQMLQKRRDIVIFKAIVSILGTYIVPL